MAVPLLHGLFVAIQEVNFSPLDRESLNSMRVAESEPLAWRMVEITRRRTRKRPEWADMEGAVKSSGARTYKCAPIEKAIVEGNGGCCWAYRKLGNEMSLCGHEKRKVKREKERHVRE